VELIEYLNPLRRWWWLLILGTALAVGAAYVALRQQPVYYEARTTLMIGRTLANPNPNYGEINLIGQLANTYVDLARRSPVRKATMERLGINRLPSYSVHLVRNTQLLEINVSAQDPRLAQAVADALAETLVAQSPTESNSEVQLRQGFVKQELNDLETGITATREQIARIETELTRMLSARDIAEAQAQIGALQGKLSNLQANYAALLSNTEQGATNTLTVVERADLPAVPTATGKTKTLATVAALGFMLSAATAYLLSYLDNTLKTPEEVKRQLGLPALAAVPDAGDSDILVMLPGHHNAASEAYRLLRTNLQFAAVDRPLRTLVVTSSAPSEGKSVTTANLAMALAQGGQQVVVVDADLHRPTVHRIFGLPNNVGLTSALLNGHSEPEELLEATSDPRLRVLTSGPIPPNPTELVGSARMREVLSALVDIADIVLIDTPPVLILADAPVLAGVVDGMLLVVEAGGTRRDAALKSIETLKAVGARLVGVVLNRVPLKGGGSYYYYDYYRDYGYSKSGARERGAGILGRFGMGKRRAAGGPPAHPKSNEQAPETAPQPAREVAQPGAAQQQ
jgi:polysaccharide biosynthesis transport protein